MIDFVGFADGFVQGGGTTHGTAYETTHGS